MAKTGSGSGKGLVDRQGMSAELVSGASEVGNLLLSFFLSLLCLRLVVFLLMFEVIAMGHVTRSRSFVARYAFLLGSSVVLWGSSVVFVIFFRKGRLFYWEGSGCRRRNPGAAGAMDATLSGVSRVRVTQGIATGVCDIG